MKLEDMNWIEEKFQAESAALAAAAESFDFLRAALIENIESFNLRYSVELHREVLASRGDRTLKLQLQSNPPVAGTLPQLWIGLELDSRFANLQVQTGSRTNRFVFLPMRGTEIIFGFEGRELSLKEVSREILSPFLFPEEHPKAGGPRAGLAF